ncbi:MAG: hypothetical protein WEA04_03265 [Candidatus Andersenbacteria bacterium]
MILKDSPPAAISHEEKLRALCMLSNVPQTIDLQGLLGKVQQAPDPETAVRTVLGTISVTSEVLERKWRSAIMAWWSMHHPHVPLLPSLALSSDEVLTVPMLQDAHAFLEAIFCQPADLVEEQGELLLNPADVLRIAGSLPSQALMPALPVESEWSYLPLRRLRATLQALRLVRPVKGRLVVVRSRYERFRKFPATQQFYLLWHADTYHVDWAEFAGMWGKFVRVIQDYLPLLWDLGEHLEPGQQVDRSHWALEVLETFAPLWEEEGLLQIGQGQAAILPIVQQHALPTILEKFMIRDILHRHGLITLSEEFGQLSLFTWTTIGASVFKAELTQELPCGLELLSREYESATPDVNSRFV